MAAAATDITPYVTTLCDRAFDAFCADMAGMFDVEIRCTRRQAVAGTVRGVQEHFPKLTAVHTIQAEGTLSGTFPVLFDHGGVFVLGGVIVMLPEPRIREGLKRGSLQDTDSLQDAAREAGNLLVGSWDRVFREGCPGHKHFLKTGTFIGKPWEGSGPKELQTPEPALLVLYEMTVAPYPSFQCAAVFPDAVLAGLTDAAREPADGPTGAEESQPPAVSAAPTPAAPRPASAAAPPASTVVPPTGRGVSTPLAGPAPQPAMAAGPRGGPAVSAGSADLSFLDPAYILSQPFSCDGALAELLRVPAAQIMEKQVVWATPDEAVQEVLARMQQHNVGYVLVGHSGVLEGLVSNSNLAGAVSIYLRPLFAQWRRPEDEATLNIKVKWIMSRPVRTVRPDAPVAAVIESMRRCGGRCLPVVDAGGTVQGIVTVFDILLRLPETQGSGMWQGRPPQAPALLL
jgi:CBS domain-containing protein